MEIFVAVPTLIQKNIKASTRQRYMYSKIWAKNIVVLIFIYEANALFLLFCNIQDTESELNSLDL